MIDLRSDTVTLPTPQMMEAIQHAELGDDVFAEDPTVNRLEQMAAERMGKEAALLVPSGTMANLVSTMTHCQRGDEAILGDQSHIHYYEAGGIAAIGSIYPHVIPNRNDGTIGLEDITAAIRSDNVHFPRTRLICLENTHNRCQGSPLTPEYTDSVCRLGHDHGINVHIDGARIFNASIALGVDVKRLTQNADSVSLCLSKALAAPVGSVVCASADFIKRARRIRKSLGGGMRQAGIIAAAGIVALETMTERLADDHANAKHLAKGLAKIDGLCVDPDSVRTNMVYFDLVSKRFNDDEFLGCCQQAGIGFLSLQKGKFRMVTHVGIEPQDIETALAVLGKVMS